MIPDTRKSIFVNQQSLWFHIWLIMILYWTKRDTYFITKCDKSLLQNASGCLVQNGAVLLQIVRVI